ncbi:MAG: tRNA preQ1(34) S-adenosylmethionine ribosyltransferase-isomerase QueA [Anaerolineae bacterium]|nr:tRNA preQ1(34) S-adenosylmethionine ribosyltransferase-isomerase QueA [Anaerolineae bacterium]
MDLSELNYNLPEHLIAQSPLEPRDSSRLLVLNRAVHTMNHFIFRDIVDFLRPSDLLIANESRVIPARLYGIKKDSGGKVEILLLHKVGDKRWKILTGGARTRIGTIIQLTSLETAPSRIGDSLSPLLCEIIEHGEKGERVAEFTEPVEKYYHQLGTMPLPPYIHQPLTDQERYQTVYAKTPGSAAAPTAGLHFTPDLMIRLRRMNVELGFVTLHIGLDTFRPITETIVEDHLIHQEWCSLSAQVAEQINRTKLAGGRVIAVGTTSVRVLETAARSGLLQSPDTLCPWRSVAPFEGQTNLYITPGFQFRVVDALITNFHLPHSSLLALVMAFAGKDFIQQAYTEAISVGYRFFSFGDAMLIL